MGKERKLIDKDKYAEQIRTIMQCWSISPCLPPEQARESVRNLRTALDILRDEPIVDVKEVVRGEWINAYPILEPHPMFAYGICSECGAETGTISNYCHNCGAKMDLKSKLTEYEKKCLFCKHNYKPLNCVPKCNCMCENYSDFELVDNIKEKF